MAFLFEEGEEVLTGSHGEHDDTFAEGSPVTDSGLSTLVFEEGTGLGGGELIVDGVTVGIFETNETHEEFWDLNYPNATPHAQGLDGFGMADQPGTHILYIFAHREQGTSNIAIGTWAYKNDSGDGEYELTYGNSNGNLDSSTTVADDPVGASGSDVYGTNGDGDNVSTHAYNRQKGDGEMYAVTGSSFTLTLSLATNPNHDPNDPAPVEYRGRGPEENTSKTAGFGSSIEVQISV